MTCKPELASNDHRNVILQTAGGPPPERMIAALGWRLRE